MQTRGAMIDRGRKEVCNQGDAGQGKWIDRKKTQNARRTTIDIESEAVPVMD